jgi:hypothetical protein
MVSKIVLAALCAALSGTVLFPQNVQATPYGSLANQISDFEIIVNDPSGLGSMALLTGNSTTNTSAAVNSVLGVPSVPNPNTQSFSPTGDPLLFGAFPASSVTVCALSCPIIPPAPGAFGGVFNTAGNPFRPPTPNPPLPFSPLSMSSDLEADGASFSAGYLNQLDFTIDVSPTPITMQFSFSSELSLVAQDGVGAGAANFIRVLDLNNNNATIFNFAPGQINTGIVAYPNQISTLNFAGSFLSPQLALPVGDYEIIVGPDGHIRTIPEPSCLLLLGSGLLILSITVRILAVWHRHGKTRPYPLA